MRKRLAVPLLILVSACLVAADWQEIQTRAEQSVWASSSLCEELRGRRVCYPPEHVFDGDPGTCWVEAAEGDGAGEWILFTVNRPFEGLRLVNGFARSPGLYDSNGRAREVGLSFVVAFTAPGLVTELDYHLYFATTLKRAAIGVDDTSEPQLLEFAISQEEHDELVWEALGRFSADHPQFVKEILKDLGLDQGMAEEELKQHRNDVFAAFGMSCVRIEILEVYAGARFADTCLSELSPLFLP